MKRSEAKSRGRPRQADTDEQDMKSRIVDAARKLFLRDGVEAVSMRNLASEVGCSPMWLYRYFGNKQDILTQVWDVFFDELFGRLIRIKAPSPRLRLEKLALAYLDYWMKHPERFLMVFLQRDLVPDGTKNYVEASGAVGRFDLFIRVVDEAKSKSVPGGPSAKEIAEGLLCVLQGLALNFITIPQYPWSDTTSLSRLTVRSYLAGVSLYPG